MKLTLPVGAAAPVAEKVAVSLTGLMVTPAVPVAGEATVVIVGDAEVQVKDMSTGEQRAAGSPGEAIELIAGAGP